MTRSDQQSGAKERIRIDTRRSDYSDMYAHGLATLAIVLRMFPGLDMADHQRVRIPTNCSERSRLNRFSLVPPAPYIVEHKGGSNAPARILGYVDFSYKKGRYLRPHQNSLKGCTLYSLVGESRATMKVLAHNLERKLHCPIYRCSLWDTALRENIRHYNRRGGRAQSTVSSF